MKIGIVVIPSLAGLGCALALWGAAGGCRRFVYVDPHGVMFIRKIVGNCEQEPIGRMWL
jgi:hypothetical protein